MKQNLLLFFRKFLKPDNSVAATEPEGAGALTPHTPAPKAARPRRLAALQTAPTINCRMRSKCFAPN